MQEITVTAAIENLDTVTDFVNEVMEQAGAPMKVQMQMAIAIDELFSNVAYYAYGEGTGPVTMQVEIEDAPRSVVLRFIDGGVPYNPLEKEDPDVTLSAEDRQIGGLGIFMVKKSMDSMEYARQDGKNVLTIRKKY